MTSFECMKRSVEKWEVSTKFFKTNLKQKGLRYAFTGVKTTSNVPDRSSFNY